MSKPLLDAIHSIQSLIANNRSAFRNERQTIRSLIDPILLTLGWDPNNYEQVQHEYTIGQERVDMALFLRGKAVALLEAKALGKRFGDKEIKQLSHYCFHAGIQTAILTNGAEWQIYRPQQLGNLPFEQRRLFHVQLGTDEESATFAARQLARLSHDAIEDLEDVAWNVLLGQFWQQHAAKELQEAFTRTLRQKFARNIDKRQKEVPLHVVRTFLQGKLGIKSQQLHRLPNPQLRPQPPKTDSDRAIILAGERILITYDYEIFVHTAEWLIRRGHLQHRDCPIHPSQRGGTNLLIHTEPKHAHGKDFSNPKKLSNGTYIETWGNINSKMSRVRHLLKRFGYPPETLQIEGFDAAASTTPRKGTDSAPATERAVVLDGERFLVQSARDVLLRTANWLSKKGHLRREDCPIRVGKMGEHRCLINTSSIHPDGTAFWAPKELENGLILEAMSSRDQSIRRARYLLTNYNFPTNTLQLIGFDY